MSGGGAFGGHETTAAISAAVKRATVRRATVSRLYRRGCRLVNVELGGSAPRQFSGGRGEDVGLQEPGFVSGQFLANVAAQLEYSNRGSYAKRQRRHQASTDETSGSLGDELKGTRMTEVSVPRRVEALHVPSVGSAPRWRHVPLC